MIKLKCLLSLIMTCGAITGKCHPFTGADSTKSIVISWQGNGYFYDATQQDDESNVEKEGLSGWKNKAAFTRIYFYPKEEGSLTVSLQLKAATGNVKLKITLDSTAQSFLINVKKTDTYVVVPVGTFTLKNPGYHFIQINGVSKAGPAFPAIQSLIVSGKAAENITYNTSEYRGAPATHLTYQYPKDSTIAWFYNEIKVPVGVNAGNAYYMTNGFGDGYAGIQVNSSTERRFIFSIWSNYKTDDPKEIPADFAVKLIKKGAGVFTGDFGNEGSGGHSHLVINWNNGDTYKFLIGAKAAGDHTIFTAYYFTPDNSAWKLLAQWDKSKTGGQLLSGLYSFVENFGSNGNDYFAAFCGNQWVCTPSGNWIELTHCRFSTTASPQKHPVFDYGAGVTNNWFYMFTGGFKQVNNVAPHDEIVRQPQGKAPNINFALLPDK